MKYAIPKRVFWGFLLKTEHLTLEASQLVNQVLDSIIKEALIAIVYFGKAFLDKEWPNLYFSLVIGTHIQECWLISSARLDSWDVIIYCDVFPDAVMVDPQVIDAQPQNSLLLKDALQTSIAVGNSVHCNCHVLEVVELPFTNDALGLWLAGVEDEFFILKNLFNPYPLDTFKLWYPRLAVTKRCPSWRKEIIEEFHIFIF